VDVSGLSSAYGDLIAHLESNDYSARYIAGIESAIHKLIRGAVSGNISSYEEAIAGCELEGLTPNAVRARKQQIRTIMNFDLYGHLPNGHKQFTYSLRSNYHALLADFKEIVDCYVKYAKKAGLSSKSIATRTEAITLLSLALQDKSICNLSQLTQSVVIELFSQSTPNSLSTSYISHIRTVLKTCASEIPECGDALPFFPVVRQSRVNISYLTPEELTKIKRQLSSEASTLSFRDKAVGVLALYTGLRCSDICGLKMSDINWDNDTISVSQQKTGFPVIIPLTATVGNAIYDYIYRERPETDCDFIFISTTHPHKNLTSTTMYNTSVRIMDAAGIRQQQGSRKGLHLFRHNFATALLGNNVPRPVITALTGHASPTSLDSYLFSDFPHLKECALSIDKFPTSEEVFNV